MCLGARAVIARRWRRGREGEEGRAADREPAARPQEGQEETPDREQEEEDIENG